MKKIFVRLDGCTFIGGYSIALSDKINSILDYKILPRKIDGYILIDERNLILN